MTFAAERVTERPPTPSDAGPTSAPRESARTAWIDVAKAIAIVLIVVYHVTSWFAATVAPEILTEEAYRVWRELSVALVPVRIPLFFLTAGILAQRAVTRSWGRMVRGRIATLLWVFTLWTILIAIPWSLRVNSSDPGSNADIAVQALIFGGAHFWFLPALAIFLCAAKALARWPRTALTVSIAIGVLVAPAIRPLAEGAGPILGVNLDRWMVFGMWFMIGCFAAPVIQRVARASRWWILPLLAVFLSVWFLVPIGGWVYQAAVLALGASGVALAVLVSVVLAASPPIRSVGRYLAQRTLPIYVVHAALLECLAVAVAWADRRGWVPMVPGDVLAVVFVPAVAALAVGASVLAAAVARRCGARWLFEAPRALTA